MSTQPTNEVPFRPDPKRSHPPIDETVKLPRHHRLAVERAEDRIAGRQPRPVEVDATSAKSGFPYTDAQIDAVLAWLDAAKLDSSNPQFSAIAIALAREGAQAIKDRRRGAQKPRKPSEVVTRRVEAVLQAFRELPPKFQQDPFGQKTIERLRTAVLQKLGLLDNDDVLSEDTIRQDIKKLRPFIRVVQKGIVPPPGQLPRTPEVSEQTRLEIERGREVSARVAAASTSPEPSEGPLRPGYDLWEIS